MSTHDDDKKKPAGPATTAQHGSRPAEKKDDKAGAADPMGQPPGPSPAPNPESAPGGDKVGGAPDEGKKAE